MCVFWGAFWSDGESFCDYIQFIGILGAEFGETGNNSGPGEIPSMETIAISTANRKARRLAGGTAMYSCLGRHRALAGPNSSSNPLRPGVLASALPQNRVRATCGAPGLQPIRSLAVGHPEVELIVNFRWTFTYFPQETRKLYTIYVYFGDFFGGTGNIFAIIYNMWVFRAEIWRDGDYFCDYIQFMCIFSHDLEGRGIRCLHITGSNAYMTFSKCICS